ncbi:MAG: DnaJ domain-containing protein [Solirubrobacterales bacterium]
MTEDPYVILGVARAASQDEIRAAYRAKAKRLHPDVIGEAASGEQMRELNLAYELLKDPALRARYDAEVGIDIHGSSFDNLEDLVRVWVDEPTFSDLPQVKLRALNREYVRMEQEGWNVERHHDHLVCTKTERGGLFGKSRKRRVTVNIDRDGQPFHVEQKRPD